MACVCILFVKRGAWLGDAKSIVLHWCLQCLLETRSIRALQVNALEGDALACETTYDYDAKPGMSFIVCGVVCICFSCHSNLYGVSCFDDSCEYRALPEVMRTVSVHDDAKFSDDCYQQRRAFEATKENEKRVQTYGTL